MLMNVNSPCSQLQAYLKGFKATAGERESTTVQEGDKSTRVGNGRHSHRDEFKVVGHESTGQRLCSYLFTLSCNIVDGLTKVN